MVVPVTLRRTPPDLLVPMLGLVGLVAITGTVAWLVRDRLPGVRRTQVGWAMLAAAGVVLLTVAAVALPDRPEHALPFAVAIAVAVSPARRTRLRLPFQVVMVVAVVVLLVRADRPLLEVGLAVFLFVFAVWLAGTLAQSFVDARHRQLTARREAERRSELLAAVGALTTRDPSDAARTVVESLRALGYSVAGVSLVREGALVPIALEGIPPSPELKADEGLVGSALLENRTVVVDDYRADPRRLPGRDDLGAAIVVPIRSGEAPVGVVMGGREAAGPLPAAEVEVAEVLAAHLGGVLETERTMRRQRELLARMQSLETMRGRLLTEVSEEVRDPLTIVRGIAETLVTHRESLSEEQRTRLLDGFVEQTRSLRATIDALLDFSRLQAARPLPTLGLCRVLDLLSPVIEGAAVEGDTGAVARTDPLLLGRALEIVASVGELRRVRITPEENKVRLQLELEPADALESSSLLLGLAERLVVTVGGSWALETGAVEVWLPRAPDDAAEAS